MNALQQSLFEDTMLTFFNMSLAKRTANNHHHNVVEVYRVRVTGQQQQQQQDDKGDNNTGSIQLYGSISGAQNAHLLAEHFANQIELRLKEDADFYLSILQASILRPYAIDDTGLYDY